LEGFFNLLTSHLSNIHNLVIQQFWVGEASTV
jgi:hypothetical protein